MKEEDRERQAARRREAVAEKRPQALREAGCDQTGTVEAKLRAVAEAARNEFPTADIDVMLEEIEAGRGTFDSQLRPNRLTAEIFK